MWGDDDNKLPEYSFDEEKKSRQAGRGPYISSCHLSQRAQMLLLIPSLPRFQKHHTTHLKATSFNPGPLIDSWCKFERGVFNPSIIYTSRCILKMKWVKWFSQGFGMARGGLWQASTPVSLASQVHTPDNPSKATSVALCGAWTQNIATLESWSHGYTATPQKHTKPTSAKRKREQQNTTL